MAETATTMRFASGVSDEPDAGEALDDVLGDVTDQMAGEPVDLALAFATPHHRGAFAAIARRIASDLGARTAIGVTAGGVIGSGCELEGRTGLTLLAARLPGVTLRPFTYEQLEWRGGEDDPDALRALLTGDGDPEAHPAAVLLFADPFSTPMVNLLPAMNRALPGVPVLGGMASGGGTAGDNRLTLDGEVMEEGAVGVVIDGPVRVDCTVSQGCRPIGEPWVITKARHNLIQQLGQRPALEAVQHTAERATDEQRHLLENQGLLIGRVINEYKPRFGRGDFLIRAIVGADKDSGYIAVNDFVRVGQTVQFHVRDARTAEEDLRLLLQSQSLHGPAAGALLCTCNGRGQNLFGEPNLESRIIRDAIGDAPMAGFFAAGEIGPIGDQNFVHGFTASLAVFRPPNDRSHA